jgi:DNA-binding CsgD family transcriptional regulator
MEMMSGAAWVRERLQAAGWTVQIADARKAKAVGSLAAKTDKLDARVLAELARRDLVPQVHVPTFADRELKERLGRRMHMIRLRTAAINRAHGVLSQFGVRLAFDRLRAPDAQALLIERGVPAVWRLSIAEAIAIVRVLDERLIPIEQELRPLARADERVRLLVTIPGIGDLLGLKIASEIGDISRFASARKLVGYSGLTPRVYQSGQKSRTGKLSTASAPFWELSQRELEVLRLLQSGLSQREIAAQLYVSFNTVRTHRRVIFQKLGVTSRSEAVARARELGCSSTVCRPAAPTAAGKAKPEDHAGVRPRLRDGPGKQSRPLARTRIRRLRHARRSTGEPPAGRR